MEISRDEAILCKNGLGPMKSYGQSSLCNRKTILYNRDPVISIPVRAKNLIVGLQGVSACLTMGRAGAWCSWALPWEFVCGALAPGLDGVQLLEPVNFPSHRLKYFPYLFMHINPMLTYNFINGICVTDLMFIYNLMNFHVIYSFKRSSGY